MEQPRVLAEIVTSFKSLWTSFATKSPKPFRLLDLPSLAHDVILSQMKILEIYQLSKCSRRSRNGVKMFTRRQKYYIDITASDAYCFLHVSNRLGRQTFHCVLRPMDNRKQLSLSTHSEDVWAATKEKIAYFFDVFTKKVKCLRFYDTTNVRNMMELLKEKTVLSVDFVVYGVRVIDDEMYKYVLKELKDVKSLSISASPSADFRFADMEPFTGDDIRIENANWLTVDNLTRCFMNFDKVWLWTSSERYLNVHVFNQFLNAWRNGLRVGKLDLFCDCASFYLQCIFKNVPTIEVSRVEVGNWKRLFNDGECFLMRQDDSGMEAIVYFNFKTPYLNNQLCFTTNFRLLRDDEFN